MTETDKATPRPWKYQCEAIGPHFEICGDHHETKLGTSCVKLALVLGNETSGDIPRANAALIVRTVNAHDSLVAACKLFASICSCGGRGDKRCPGCIAKAALAKAEGAA